MSYTKQLQGIIEDYRRAKQPWPAQAHDIAIWAIQNGRWKPQPETIINQCADQLSRAMREEYLTDPQGRRVRAKHVATVEQHGKQMIMWDDIRTASPAHMEIAFQQRRRSVVGDCCQLKTDVDSYNENNPHGARFQLILNFENDVIEAELASNPMIFSTALEQRSSQPLGVVQALV